MAKTTPEKGHSQPAPKRQRCDLLGRGRALWTWQGGRPQPLTESTCSAATKGNWNCKTLPVFTLLPALQLAARDRDFPIDQLTRGRMFFFQTGALAAVTNATATTAYDAGTSSMLDSSALESKSLMKQHTNIFLPFCKHSANYFFSCRHMEKRMVRQLAIAEKSRCSWIVDFSTYHLPLSSISWSANSIVGCSAHSRL